VIFPLHPRTAAQVKRFGLADLLAGLQICEPLAPSTFWPLRRDARLIVSDSGGLQEEVTVLKTALVGTLGGQPSDPRVRACSPSGLRAVGACRSGQRVDQRSRTQGQFGDNPIPVRRRHRLGADRGASR